MPKFPSPIRDGPIEARWGSSRCRTVAAGFRRQSGTAPLKLAVNDLLLQDHDIRFRRQTGTAPLKPRVAWRAYFPHGVEFPSPNRHGPIEACPSAMRRAYSGSVSVANQGRPH